MNAKSGNGRSGTFIWGVIAGVVALFGAGWLYLSGNSGGESEHVADVQEQTEQTSEADAQATTGDQQTEVADADTPQAVEAAPETGDAEAGQTTGAAPADTAQADTAQTDAPDEPADAASEPADAQGMASVAPPVLDQIFVEKDGNALLSGKAAPGSQIRVLLDGEPVHSFEVDDSGQFAEFVTIPFSETARGLVLENSDGKQSASSDDYLIAALPKPVAEEAADQVASVAPAASEADAGGEGDTAQGGTDTPEGEAEQQVADTGSGDATATGDEDQQIAVLRSGEEGVELVQPPSGQSAAPDQVALDTIGYSDTGEVQLTGRVQDGATIRLYLDNRLVGEVTPQDGGNWRGEVEGVEPGVYTLRVDEVDTDGTVVSRLETPFKREPVELLQAAEAGSDAQGAETTAPIRSVTVQKGDTLWAISRDRFGDGVLYVKLFEANRGLIRNPDLIYPGQVFTIPE